ncbi:MAG TPA: hypothetical protein VM555_07540, partial [Tahibacter sp.]|nr:hypothetical protein [Tahibacter sp.]
KCHAFGFAGKLRNRAIGFSREPVDDAADIRDEWLVGKQRIGVTAGASAPEQLVRGVVDRLTRESNGTVTELSGEPEGVTFALPKELRIQLIG